MWLLPQHRLAALLALLRVVKVWRRRLWPKNLFLMLLGMEFVWRLNGVSTKVHISEVYCFDNTNSFYTRNEYLYFSFVCKFWRTL